MFGPPSKLVFAFGRGFAMAKWWSLHTSALLYTHMSFSKALSNSTLLHYGHLCLSHVIIRGPGDLVDIHVFEQH